MKCHSGAQEELRGKKTALNSGRIFQRMGGTGKKAFTYPLQGSYAFISIEEGEEGSEYVPEERVYQ